MVGYNVCLFVLPAVDLTTVMKGRTQKKKKKKHTGVSIFTSFTLNGENNKYVTSMRGDDNPNPEDKQFIKSAYFIEK